MHQTSFALKKLRDDGFGAEITGIDLSQPVPPDTFRLLQDAFDVHALLLFRGQRLGPSGIARFARLFGPLRRLKLFQPRPGKDPEYYSCPEEPDVTVVGTVKRDGWPKPMFTNSVENWHVDESYKPRPNRATVLYAMITPGAGDETAFNDMQAAYDALDHATKERIDTLCGHYSVECLDAIFRKSEPSRPPLLPETLSAHPPVSHPLVRVHPATGRKSLFMSPEVISHFGGMARKGSLDLVDALTTHALQPKFQYRHVWHTGDLLIWDNHFTMHRATAFDAERYERLFLRTMIDDDAEKGANGTRSDR